MQELRFVMNDIDDGGEYEEIGNIEVTLGSILHSKNQTFMDRLQFQGSEKKIGQIIVRAEPVEETNMAATFKLEWSNVNNIGGGCIGMCGRRQSYRYTIERKIPNTERFVIVKKSYPYKEQTFGKPAQEVMFVSDLCNNDDSIIKFAIRKDTDKMQEINSVQTTLKALKESQKHDLSGRNGARLNISDFNLEVKPNFNDYLKGGSEIELTFALDFSSPKGHHVGDSEDQKLSQYEKAIQQVGNVISKYDSDNLFPVYGFGGTPQGAKALSHCFHLN